MLSQASSVLKTSDVLEWGLHLLVEECVFAYLVLVHGFPPCSFTLASEPNADFLTRDLCHYCREPLGVELDAQVVFPPGSLQRRVHADRIKVFRRLLGECCDGSLSS